MALRVRLVASATGIALVSTLGVNAALQASTTSEPPAGEANVRGYGVLGQNGGAATAIANVAGARQRTAHAAGITDPRGMVDSVRVVARVTRSPQASNVEGTLRADGIHLFNGRVRIAWIDAKVRGQADRWNAHQELASIKVGEVTVDGETVRLVPGKPVDVVGAGQFSLGETSRGENGVLRVSALRVSAKAEGNTQPLVIGFFNLATAPGTTVLEPVETTPSTPAAPNDAPVRSGRGRSGNVPDARNEPGRPDGNDQASSVSTPSQPSKPPSHRAPLPTRPTPPTAVVPHMLPGSPLRSTPRNNVGRSTSIFPVQGTYSYTNDYGAPRAGTGWHQGNDIFAAVGTPIVAVADGTLSKVGWNTLGGHRLWLTDRDGTAYYYAHLSAYSPDAVEGAVVKAGQTIGFVGNTGQASTTPPHLHFEVHPGGITAPSINPYPLLKQWEAAPPRPTPIAALSLPKARADAAAGAVVVGVEVDHVGAPMTGDGTATPAR